MQKSLIAVWVFLAGLFAACIFTEVSVTYAQSAWPGPDTPRTGGSHPLWDNTTPEPPTPLATSPEVTRAIADLEIVKSELMKSYPDRQGRRAKAMQHVNSALDELNRARRTP
jgi:hypothetical protein